MDQVYIIILMNLVKLKYSHRNVNENIKIVTTDNNLKFTNSKNKQHYVYCSFCVLDQLHDWNGHEVELDRLEREVLVRNL